MTAYRFRRWCGSECGGGGRTCAPSGVKRWQADERERYQSEIKMSYELKIKTRKLLGTKLNHGLHARRPRDPRAPVSNFARAAFTPCCTTKETMRYDPRRMYWPSTSKLTLSTHNVFHTNRHGFPSPGPGLPVARCLANVPLTVAITSVSQKK